MSSIAAFPVGDMPPGQLGISVTDVAQVLAPARSSSRYNPVSLSNGYMHCIARTTIHSHLHINQTTT